MTRPEPDTRNGPMRTVRRLLLPAAAMAVVVTSMVAPAPAAAKPPPIAFTEVNHFEKSFYLPPNPDCGAISGVTIFAQGTEHLHVTEFDDSYHVAYGETFKIQEVSDDPSIPVVETQGTDALTYHFIKGGAVEVFHESFHDNNTPWGDIAFYTTFVVVNGEVHVDHTFGRDNPPEGC